MPTDKVQQLESALSSLSPTDFIRLDNAQLSTLEKLLARLSEQTEAQRLYRGLAAGNRQS